MLSRLSHAAEAVARRAVELAPMPQPALTPTRYPVVFFHGLGALANLMQGGVLHAEAMHLRARGVWAYAPHVNPYDTVAVRAEAWAERLAAVLDETGAEKVNVVGFSSGGLDARYLAQDEGWAGRVASLVTISTPHRGSPLASFVLERPGRLRHAVLGVMSFAGRAAYEAAAPQAEASLRELTPEGVAARLPSDEAVPGAWCGSFDSYAGRGTDVPIYAPLRLPNRILHAAAGLNDGIVPTASMRWAEHLGTIEADHARQIGLALAPATDYDSLSFAEAHVAALRQRGL